MNETFDLIYYRHNKKDALSPIPKSQIKFRDFTFVLAGSLRYRVDGSEITVSAGDAMMIPQNAFRERLVSPPADYVSFNYVSDETSAYPVLMENVVGNEITLLSAALDEICADKPFSPQPVALILASILYCVRVNLDKRASNPTADEIERYLLDNYARKITLADVAARTYFSVTHCDVLFKKAKGKYIVDYLLDIRVQEAKKLLIEGALSLPAVAEAVGFTDYNYFSRLFKKRVGYPPKVYQSLVLKSIR